MRTYPRDLAAAFLSVALLATPLVAQTGSLPHLDAARDLVARVSLDHTRYEHGQGTVDWGSTPSSYTDCSGLIDHLLMHSYGYTPADFTRWFGSRRPSAQRYFDAISEQTGFSRLERVQDLRPGDLISVKYLRRTDNTGHIMIVNAPAEHAAPRRTTSRPAESQGESWLVPVIDSSESGHGPTDTRHKLGDGGHDHEGIGSGVLRLYADAQGHVTGFSWSNLNVSEFRSPDAEPVVLGRLVQGYKP
jgi:hypothetical protein